MSYDVIMLNLHQTFENICRMQFISLDLKGIFSLEMGFDLSGYFQISNTNAINSTSLLIHKDPQNCLYVEYQTFR